MRHSLCLFTRIQWLASLGSYFGSISNGMPLHINERASHKEQGSANGTKEYKNSCLLTLLKIHIVVSCGNRQLCQYPIN